MVLKEGLDWAYRAIITTAIAGALAWGGHVSNTQTAQATTLAATQIQIQNTADNLKAFHEDISAQLNRMEAKQDAGIIREIKKGRE